MDTPYSTTGTREAFAPRVAPSFLDRLPLYTYLGLALNILAWISSWARIGPWNHTFFPLWFGFILLLDGLNVARRGTSPLARGPLRFAALFLFSSPFWWIFEALNSPAQNWHYRLDGTYSGLTYNILASISFSTVLPAVMEMTELLASFKILRPRLAPPTVGPRLSRRAAGLSIAAGLVMAALPLAFPRYAYPLIWGCLILILDPINNRAGRKSAFGHLLARDWRFLVVLPLATLCCGFFWEMWNYYALPQWFYTTPFVDAAPHLFEMPLPGFIGYLPFGVELFAMYQFALLVLGRRKDALSF